MGPTIIGAVRQGNDVSSNSRIQEHSYLTPSNFFAELKVEGIEGKVLLVIDFPCVYLAADFVER